MVAILVDDDGERAWRTCRTGTCKLVVDLLPVDVTEVVAAVAQERLFDRNYKHKERERIKESASVEVTYAQVHFNHHDTT